MTLIIEDAAVPKVVEAIIQSNRTGQRGDGKIFVLPLAEVVRIRTGEKDAAAVN